jgi:hypothetical protein
MRAELLCSLAIFFQFTTAKHPPFSALKKNKKNFQKPIDNQKLICYNLKCKPLEAFTNQNSKQ